MDPSIYYNSWWSNHNSGNNWYMDPHKSGALNQPPPAHNMSGPPQHPPPHGLPMGQPMAPRALQPGYMSPRPAHTGSSVPVSPKSNQAPALGPKQPHPGGSSSPKPPPASSTPPQDKVSMMGVPPKPSTPPTSNVVSTPSAVGANKASVIPSLIQAGASKPVHNMPQPQNHQLNLMQQYQQRQPTQQHMQQQQSILGQQQMNASQQQIQVNQQQQQSHIQQQTQQQQQHHHHLQQQQAQQQQQQQQQHQQQQQQQQQQQIHSQTQLQHQQQMNPQPTSGGPIQQHNQTLQCKTASTQNLGAPAKHEALKAPTPPVPDLISIKQPPTSQPLPASPAVKPPSFDNKAVSQNQSLSAKTFPQQSSNNTMVSASPVKLVQNASNANSQLGSLAFPSQVPPKPMDSAKPPNVSIIPAKPTSTQKSEASKSGDATNTVTITPSLKSSENQEAKSISDIAGLNAMSVGPNQNGMTSAKAPVKPPVTCSSAKPTEQASIDSKPTTIPTQSVKNTTAAAVTSMTSATKLIQPSIPKQTSTVPLPRQSPTQPSISSSKPVPAVKPPLSPSTNVHSNQVEAVSFPPIQNLQPKTGLAQMPPSPQKPTAPAVTPKPAPAPTQPQTKMPSPILTQPSPMSSKPVSATSTISPSKPATPPTVTKPTVQSFPKEPGLNISSSKKPPPEKNETTPKVEANKPDVQSLPLVSKREIGRFPRSRKPALKEPLQSNEIKKDIKDKEMVSDEEEEEEPVRKRPTRAKRKVADTPNEGERRSKRSRNPAPVYQSPVPDSLSRLTKSLISTPKTPQEKLVYFFKNEHVALRNAEGTFYLCQIAQNVYRSTRKIKIRWLTPVEENEENCDNYKPDYYDITDFDCILTSVALQKTDNKIIMRLPAEEKTRILNILQRAIDRDKGIPQEKSELKEDHPDGLDLSLYNDESQLKKRKRKGRRGRKNKDETSSEESEEDDDEDEEETEDEKVSEPEDESEEEIEPPPKVARATPGRRRGRGAVAAQGKQATPAPTPKEKPAAPAPATPKPAASHAPPKAPTPPVTPALTPRRGVRTFGSSRSVTRARAPGTVPPVQAQATLPPAKEGTTLAKPDQAPKQNSQDSSPKTSRGTRSAPKSVSKASATPKEAPATPKVTRRTRK